MMKPLIVATNATPADIILDLQRGQHHRLDYAELATRLSTRYVDYGIIGENRPIRRIEQLLRMDIRLARCVARIVHDEQYDTVFSLSERVALPLTWFLDRKVKHVVIMHHPMSPEKLRVMRLLNVKERWSRIITISRSEAEGLKNALNLPENFVYPLLTPVDTDFFRPAGNLALEEEPEHIQSVGLSHRDYPTLLRAMRRLPHVTCYLRTGSTWVDHSTGIEHERIPGNVQLRPFVHPAVLRECYERSRFIVLPAENGTQWSAGATSVQQPQAMGKAVIATARPGLSEYLVDGETGLLVPPGDDRAMAEAIDYLWNRPDVAAEMGRRGRQWLIENHSMDIWLTRAIELLNVEQVHAPPAGRLVAVS